MDYHFIRNKLRRSVFYLREYFFPSGCSLCGADLYGGGEWYGLCEACHAQIERELDENRKGAFCDNCGKPLISEHGICLACRQTDALAFDGVKVLFPYAGKYRKLLAAYKFGKNLAVGNFFAEKMREALEDKGAALVPVPPRPGKIRNSGWDQVEYLARQLEKNGEGIRISRCLKRLPSQSQKELNKEKRRTNLQGRIIPVRQTPQTAILIDDVMTTGATLEACAQALKASGTQTVYGLCLFYD